MGLDITPQTRTSSENAAWMPYPPGGNSYAKGNLKQFALPDNAPEATGQLYNLKDDPGETKNLFFSESAKREEMQAILKKLTVKDGGRSAPTGRKPIGIKNIPRLDK